GKKVSNGGGDGVVVWCVNAATGGPTLIQRAWTDSYELRTFSMDPSGKVLIAASTTPMPVMDQGMLSQVSAGLSIYKVGADGKLASAGKVDVDTSTGVQFWADML